MLHIKQPDLALGMYLPSLKGENSPETEVTGTRIESLLYSWAKLPMR